MAAIISLWQEAVFGPKDIQAMSMALDDICKKLKLSDGDHPARRVIAERVIALARFGERNPTRLRDRILKEASVGGRWLSSDD